MSETVEILEEDKSMDLIIANHDSKELKLINTNHDSKELKSVDLFKRGSL